MHRPDLIEQFAREKHEQLLKEAEQRRLLNYLPQAQHKQQVRSAERNSFAARLLALLRFRPI
ncbi:MAG: hypothetical protein Fur005_37660 [Roseiflexaceae bacterium]